MFIPIIQSNDKYSANNVLISGEKNLRVAIEESFFECDVRM
jgi:hypothetical protein